MRRRESSSTSALQRHAKHYATDYFGTVIERMERLRDVLEHTDDEITDRGHFHTFDRDNRIIDYVLVYDKTSRRPSKEKVNNFLKHLISEGFSTEGGESEIFEHLIFIRIHCHRSKLIKAAVVLDMNLAFLAEYEEKVDFQVFFNFNFLFNDLTRPKELSDLSQRAQKTTYNIKPEDITMPERIMVAHELVKNIKYGDDDDEYGINSLLHKGYLHCAFPLHDGTWEWSEEGHLNDRQILMKYWANFSNFYKLQPINHIRQYFGPEVAFYFAFMGYFNGMLIVPAIAGIMSVYYGMLTSADDRNYRTMEICVSNITICPPCHDMSICHYEQLNNECQTSQFAYVFDNFTSAVYSIFWCFWSTLVYARWKRQECKLMFRWNIMDVEHDCNIRPQYLTRAMGNQGEKSRSSDIAGNIYLSVENQRREARYLRVLRLCASGLIIFLLVSNLHH